MQRFMTRFLVIMSAAALLVGVVPIGASAQVGERVAGEIPRDEQPEPIPKDEQTWKSDGQIRLFTVILTTGEVVQVEGYGDIVLDGSFAVKHLNLTLSEVKSEATGESTGLISIHSGAGPRTGSGKAGSSFRSTFSADVQYPLLAELHGYTRLEEDSYGIPVETSFATFEGEFVSETWAFGCLDISIDESLSELIQEISVCEVPVHDGGDCPDCPPEKKCDKKKLCIQPIVITDADGSNPTSCPSFQATKDIWAKCCKEVTVKAEKKLNKPGFKQLHVGTTLPTPEERDLWDELKDDGNKPPNNDCVEVYCVARFVDGAGNPTPDTLGGAYTTGSGTASAGVVVQSDSHANNVAHEVGHAVGAGHTTDGSVMQPSGSNSTGTSAKQSKKNCEDGMKGNCKVKEPKEACCKTYEIN